MFLRALLAFLALPGIVAFLVPALIVARYPAPSRISVLGVVIWTVGVGVLLSCVWSFYTTGKGTLAPWSPPSHLVSVGLYRYTRNPMYVGVLLILAGWAISYRSRALAAYAAIVGLAFHLRVVYGEEPWLARKYGAEWQAYRDRVPRWFGQPQATRRP
jgi:Putative protein-S-isoprenylcysteine methyltransferase